MGQNPDRRDRQIIERPFPNDESRARLVFPPEFSKEKDAAHGSGEKSGLLVEKGNPNTIAGSIVDKDNPVAVAVAGTTIDKVNPTTVAGTTIDEANPVQTTKGTGEELAGPSVPKQPKPKPTPKPTPKPKPQSTPSVTRADEATSSDGRVTDAQIGEMEDWLVASENPIWPMKEKEKWEEKGKGKEEEEGEEEGNKGMSQC